MRGQVPSQRRITREGAANFLAGQKIIILSKNVEFHAHIALEEVGVSLIVLTKLFSVFLSRVFFLKLDRFVFNSFLCLRGIILSPTLKLL